jgi:hypothetical protein
MTPMRELPELSKRSPIHTRIEAKHSPRGSCISAGIFPIDSAPARHRTPKEKTAGNPKMNLWKNILSSPASSLKAPFPARLPHQRVSLNRGSMRPANFASVCRTIATEASPAGSDLLGLLVRLGAPVLLVLLALLVLLVLLVLSVPKGLRWLFPVLGASPMVWLMGASHSCPSARLARFWWPGRRLLSGERAAVAVGAVPRRSMSAPR